jgi:hypothetical protein
MKFYYILSSEFDYNKLIWDGAGLGYARTMDWDPVEFLDFEDKYDPEGVYIFDARISLNEIKKIPLILNKYNKSIFGFAVVDPGEYHIEDAFSRQAAFCARFSNTFLLLKYHPVALLNFLSFLYPTRSIIIPFAYDKSREENREIRKNKIILSGKISSIYPEREWFEKRMKLPILSFFMNKLKHPGYTDVGEKKQHSLIGSSYINFLSNYRFMFVSPSMYKVELLKYNECAYAGCIPVGFPPDNYPEEIKKLFILPNFSIRGFPKFAMDLIKSDFSTVKTYREYLSATRNKYHLNDKLREFINSLK